MVDVRLLWSRDVEFLQRYVLSLFWGVIDRSRFVLAVTLELGGESPVSLLPSNSSSLGHLDVVGDELGEGCLWILVRLEILEVFEWDAGVE